jgi:hypothetical protein
VDLPYSGLGAFFDLDNDEQLEFMHLLVSKGAGEGSTAQILSNQFAPQP